MDEVQFRARRRFPGPAGAKKIWKFPEILLAKFGEDVVK